jgi:hypothetical protein
MYCGDGSSTSGPSADKLESVDRIERLPGRSEKRRKRTSSRLAPIWTLAVALMVFTVACDDDGEVPADAALVTDRYVSTRMGHIGIGQGIATVFERN